MKLAIMGFGTIGSGVAAIVEQNAALIERRIGAPLEVKYVLDLREFPGTSVEHKVVHDIDIIVNDPEIDVVVETMGGVEPACTFVKKALNAGKSVTTSNKVLVEKKGAELLALAEEKGASFLFEASVGGGIPIIRPLNQCLTGDRITGVTGILNGTTNYMLTKMDREGVTFEAALKEAQRNGFAEADPTADVEGIDAGRKICILADLCFGKNVPPSSITTEGITKITPADIECARILGYKIKLLGRAMRTGPNSVSAFVAPHLVSKSNPLANVDGVINGISVKGDAVGEAMFFGPGAGAHPTASAVAGDIIDCVRDPSTRAYMGWWPSEPGYVTGPEKLSCRWMVRVVAPLSQIGAAFQGVRFIPAPNAEPDEYAFVTPYMPGEELSARMSGMDVRARYRVLD